MPFGSQALASPTLRAPTFFHPKLYYFENAATGNAQLLSASANLTYRGLRASVEHFFAWSGARTDPEATAFQNWWNQLWPQSDAATAAFIDTYESRRPLLPTPLHAIRAGPPDAVLQAASRFWIELTRPPEGGCSTKLSCSSMGTSSFICAPACLIRPCIDHLASRTRLARLCRRGPANHVQRASTQAWREPDVADLHAHSSNGLRRLPGRRCDHSFHAHGTTRPLPHRGCPAWSPQALNWITTAIGILSQAPPPPRMGWS